MNFVQKYTNKGVYLYQQQNIINFLKEVFLMRITRKQLETKLNSYNNISDIKLKLNDDVIGAINLYTEDNNRIATATTKDMFYILDALINVKALERNN